MQDCKIDTSACGYKTNNPRACIKECNECDVCSPCRSNVHICSFVVPTLEEGRVFRDSFVFNQEDDSVYYIAADGAEVAFGTRPLFIDGFDPHTRSIPRQLVFDFTANKGYVYNPEGKAKAFDLKEI